MISLLVSMGDTLTLGFISALLMFKNLNSFRLLSRAALSVIASIIFVFGYISLLGFQVSSANKLGLGIDPTTFIFASWSSLIAGIGLIVATVAALAVLDLRRTLK